MNNTLDKETFAAFQGSSPFFKKCVSLVHKIARQASLIKSKIEISDFEIAKKQSVLHVYTSEKIFQDYGKTKDGYFRAMFYYSLYMGYLVADSWNDCEETVKYDWCLECLYEYDTCRAIVEKYGRKFLDVQRDAYLQILKLLQKEKKDVVNLLFALEAFFQLGVTLALTSTFDEREFLEGLGLL